MSGLRLRFHEPLTDMMYYELRVRMQSHVNGSVHGRIEKGADPATMRAEGARQIAVFDAGLRGGPMDEKSAILLGEMCAQRGLEFSYVLVDPVVVVKVAPLVKDVVLSQK